MSAFDLEVLDRSHDREGFDCGVEELNRYFRHVARQHIEKGLAKTYVLCDAKGEAPKAVAGYFTLTLCEGLGTALPPALARKLPEKLPAIRLGRLAVAVDRQRSGLGARLLAAAMVKVQQVADVAGCIGLFVDAKDDAAAAYYARFGFVALVDAPLTLFLPISTISDFVKKTFPTR